MSLSRREFLGSGLAAFGAGIAARLSFGAPPPPPHGLACDTGALDLWRSVPLPHIPWMPDSVQVDGLPFAPWWSGDTYRLGHIPFHAPEIPPPPFSPPPPQESTAVAIVGGGLSGLACAYNLRRFRPVVFELYPQFGGTSRGEVWGNTPYSLGGAYFINPDEGSYLESLYHQLGVDRVRHLSPATDDPVELAGSILPDASQSPTLDEQGREAFRQYRSLVASYVENYPEIPLEDGVDNAWILDLDRISLEQAVRGTLTVPVPPLLHAAIQGYCYSSFNAGWHEISAASGWNFIAAEELGRWVLPGGNSGLIQAFLQQLLPLEWGTPHRCRPRHLRASCRVVDIRRYDAEHTLVTWRDDAGVFRSLAARRVIVTSPKHIIRHMIPDLVRLDPELSEATHRVYTASYLVANVLLTRRMDRNFYDLFLLKDGRFPLNDADVPAWARITDAVNADLPLPPHHHASVLTLYWPLPYPTSRFNIIEDEAWATYAHSAAAQVRQLLALLNVRESSVRQIRLTRFGHAMPIASTGFIAAGLPAIFRRPHQQHVYFAHCDNWALPAVETCLTEAKFQSDAVAATL